MIVKKPYAFLIKHFRHIHGLLFVMLLFLTIKLISIYTFFNGYATEHYYINTGTLESTYVPIILFIIAILAIIMLTIIFYLLNLKRKETKIYILSILYQIVVIVYLLVMLDLFHDLNLAPINTEEVRLNRDISLIIFIPQLILSFLILGRALGFNVQQFDFKKDIQELEIDNTDNEEIELSIGNNTYKIKRYLRKMSRLTKYFIFENKMFVIISSSVLVLITSATILINIKVYTENYNENTEIIANSLSYTVKSSYITNKAINNRVIAKNKYYLIVELLVENKLRNDYMLTRDNFRLEIDEELLFPIFSVNDKFMDFGEVFSPTEIEKNTKKQYIIVYEIDNKNVKKEYLFKIKNYDNKIIGDMQSLYKDIMLKPKNLNKITSSDVHNLTANVDLKDTVLKNTKLTISKYEIANKFNDKYKSCKEEKCTELTYIVTPNNIGKGNLKVLKLDSKLEIDKTLYVSRNILNSSDLIGNYGYINYKIDNEIKTSYLEKIKVLHNEDKFSYFEIPEEVENADKIELILLIRGIKYTINLK